VNNNLSLIFIKKDKKMATTLEKIKTLLSSDKNKKVELYAEMILDDGRVLATEDEKFAVGSVVFVVGDDGETESVVEGEYTLEDGTKIGIDAESKIASMGEEKEEEVEAEEEEKEEMQEEEEEEKDIEKLYAELRDRVDAIEKKMYEEEDKEEMSEEVEESEVKNEEEKVEMSKDLVTSLVEEVEHLKEKLVEFEKLPAEEGFIHSPETNKKQEKVNLAKLSTKERVAYFINNKN
jgi:myosin heavy subunit